MAEETVASIPAPRVLPWHATVVDQARAAWSANRFPHGILLQGAEGLGKRELASWLAAALLCETSGSGQLQFCGRCPSCQLIAAGSHPDRYWVNPEEDKQQISVDQIREVCARLTQTSYRHGYKVAVVEPAHQMTISAANSLLKTLEEPTARSVLILVTSRPSGLPATVRSRCQKMVVHGPASTEAIEWLRQEAGAEADPQLLEFTGNAPLRALDFARGGRFDALNERMQKSLGELLSGRSDVTQLAAEWDTKDAKPQLPDRLTWLDLWLTSVARAAIGGSADLFTFPARSAHLPSLPGALNISALYAVVDQVRALKSQLTRTALQRELAIESLLHSVLQVLGPRNFSR